MSGVRLAQGPGLRCRGKRKDDRVGGWLTCADGFCGYGIRLYCRRRRITASFGRACTVLPLIPVRVFPANRALIMAPSGASKGAASSGLIRSLGRVVTCLFSERLKACGLAVEKAIKISPEP